MGDNPLSWLGNGYTVADYDGSCRTSYLDPALIDYPPLPGEVFKGSISSVPVARNEAKTVNGTKTANGIKTNGETLPKLHENPRTDAGLFGRA
jgi:hypothetical protein